MTAWSNLVARSRRRSLGRSRGDDGFALIATLLILATSSIIILGLLTYTMTTVKFASAQTLRDEQIAAGDGALEAMVNTIARDATARLGVFGSFCTPDLLNHANEEDKKFNYTINGTKVQVTCEPKASGLPPIPVDTNLADVVNVIGDGSGYTGDFPIDAACTDGDRNQPACPHWDSAVPGQTNATVAATKQGLTHVGPSALWFVADQLRVSTGAAALRSPLICDSAATGCTPGLPAGPASGATGTYVQGKSGLFKTGAPTSPDGTPCGVLQQGSSVPAAQVVTPTAQRTVCNDSITAGLNYSSGSGVVPEAPLSNAGTVIGTPEWVQANRQTKLGDSAGTTIAGHNTCPASAWTPTAANPHPIPANIITFNPGAYTRLEMATINKWTSGACVGVIYWFKPGDYWLDMYDSGETQLKITAARSYLIFGTPTGGSLAATDFLTTPLCDKTQPGVSITLSQRTSISHTKGRVAVCGQTEKAAIYQSTQANLGWSAVPTAGYIGTTASVSSPANGFAQLFAGWTGSPTAPTQDLPGVRPQRRRPGAGLRRHRLHRCQLLPESHPAHAPPGRPRQLHRGPGPGRSGSHPDLLGDGTGQRRPPRRHGRRLRPRDVHLGRGVPAGQHHHGPGLRRVLQGRSRR